jgi:hypothetical protein
MKSDDLLKYFRTDQPWIEQLESLRTDHPFDQRWSKWSQQQRNKNRNRAMILVMSGVITVGLAFGSLVYAEPILEPQIGKEPSFPHGHLIKQKHLFHRFHSEPLLDSRSEPSESPVLQETPKDTEFQPKPSEKEEEPILDKSEPIAEKVEKKEEPQKVDQVDQPIEKKEPETTAPVKTPTTTVHSEPASIQTFSAKGAHESQPLKRVKEISSPSAKEAEQPVAANKNSVTSEEIDNTPLQKTENGGTLPKTAGDSIAIAIFGLLLIAGGGQLEVARRMWMKHV